MVLALEAASALYKSLLSRQSKYLAEKPIGCRKLTFTILTIPVVLIGMVASYPLMPIHFVATHIIGRSIRVFYASIVLIIKLASPRLLRWLGRFETSTTIRATMIAIGILLFVAQFVFQFMGTFGP